MATQDSTLFENKLLWLYNIRKEICFKVKTHTITCNRNISYFTVRFKFLNLFIFLNNENRKIV